MITLKGGQFGQDFLVVSNTGEDLLIQTDYDYPGVAMTFGWSGEDSDIDGAYQFLTNNADNDEWVEDPRYFNEE